MTAATLLPSSTTSPGAPPPLPDRPESLASVVNRTASNYSTYNSTARPFASPYGYGGGFSSYSSPYNRFGTGGFGSMYGSGYGGYGGMYGGGMPGGGMPGMYGGMQPGMPDPNNPSLTQTFSQSTQATFQLIESIVGAFGGFAQMLESTYMATHSSFFGTSQPPCAYSANPSAMVSVAEQFGNLRHTLGSVLGIYTLIRWLRSLLARLTGQPLPARSKDLTPAKFAAFSGRLPDGSPAPPRPSRKPLVVFALAVFGLPYLMGKLIKALAARQEEQAKQQAMLEGNMAGGDAPLDPNSLTFCRVLYDYAPEAAAANPAAAVPGVDLSVNRGDLVAVLSRADPLGGPSQWWRCRTRDGRVGYLPAPYLEVMQRRGAAAAITSGSPGVTPAGSRAQTMTSAVVEGLGRGPDGGEGGAEGSSRTSTLTGLKVEDIVGRGAPQVKELVGKGPEAIPVESFQRSMFNST
jgi:peroxin-13